MKILSAALVAGVLVTGALFAPDLVEMFGELDSTSYTTDDLRRMLDALPVAPEITDPPYVEGLFPSNSDPVPEPGCSTWQIVIHRTATVTADERVEHTCERPKGTWLSRYDGTRATSTRGVVVVPYVPYGEAWRSGAAGWSGAKLAAYANDSTRMDAVSIDAAAARADHDPATWMPIVTYTCPYLGHYLDAKQAHGLTLDQAEHDAIATIIAARSNAGSGC